MSDPRRWLDDGRLDRDLREVLGAYRSPEPMDAATRRRSGAAVAQLAAGTLTTAASAGATGGAVGVGMGVKLTAALLVMGGIAGGVTWSASSDGGPIDEGPASVPGGPALAPGSDPVGDVASDPPTDVQDIRAPGLVEERAAELLDRGPMVPATRPPAARGRSPGADPRPADPLAAETALLSRARRELAARPAAALAATVEHRRRFADGQLGAERELIAVDALQRLGRHGEAQRRAFALIERNPGGFYARRAREIQEGR